MPNWVFNQMTITGSKEDLDSIESLFAKPIQTTQYNAETKKDEQVLEDVVFTYSALLSHSDMGISDEEYYAVNGFANGVQTGNTSGNWYNWNNMHWGVKWDAVRPLCYRASDTKLIYEFESPWGPPNDSLWVSLSYLYEGRIHIDYTYEEEQGWGGSFSIVNNEIVSEEQWDIPNSHAEMAERVGGCYCEMWVDDVDSMFDDCPAKMEMQDA